MRSTGPVPVMVTWSTLRGWTGSSKRTLTLALMGTSIEPSPGLMPVTWGAVLSTVVPVVKLELVLTRLPARSRSP